MNVDRLERLAKLLEADANNPNGVKFDLRYWARDTTQDPEHWATQKLSSSTYDEVETKSIPVNCGTAACALGLAAISDTFKGEGLTWRVNSSGSMAVVYDNDGLYESGYWAGAKFFDIDPSIAQELFAPDYYTPFMRTGRESELEVARRIRNVINTGKTGII